VDDEEKQRSNKQAVVKEAWLGNFPDRDNIHPAAAVAAARMRVMLFDALMHDWIHPYTLKKDGKTYKLWVLAHLEGKRDYMAPVADTKNVAVAERADKDEWDPQGTEIDFRLFEPITLEGRVLSGGPFIYGTRREAEDALAELIFESAAIVAAKGRESGSLDEAVAAWVDRIHERVRTRSARYRDVPEEIV